MKKLLEDILLTGLGTIVVTRDKAKELIEKMIDQGDMTRQEGKELLDKFLQKTENETSKISDKVSSELSKRLEKAGFVTEDKVEKLEARIENLESKIENMNKNELDEQDE